jgi:hypothetical protein
VAICPQANYTGRATAVVSETNADFCGQKWSAQRIPTAVNLGFLDRSRYFFFQVALQLSSQDYVDPVPDPLLVSSDCPCMITLEGRGCLVGIATDYGLENPGVGIRVPVGSRILASPYNPDQLWFTLRLLSNGPRGFFIRK